MPFPTPVIIDTDPGVDDALALLLAAASPELEVLAVTTVAGNVSLARATENARSILPVAWDGTGAQVPPLYWGGGDGLATAEFVHGGDGLGGATLLRTGTGSPRYPPAAPIAGEDAAGAILGLAAAHPGKVTLIAIGPLTNVAAALSRHAEGLRQLRRIIVMGGAFREPGNSTPVAEFNVFADPEAAQAVSRAGIPLTWVPLDVTHRCLLRPEALAALPDTPRVRFARDILGPMMDYHARGHGEPACFLHDPLAVGVVLWQELVQAVPLCVEVETEGRLTRGMTVADFRPPGHRPPAIPNGEVCLEVDAGEFVRRFLERLGRTEH
jgi:inosine-uridine nucleoside N-ribohydrolase